MPFAPKIRKTILRALDDSIIPALQNAIVLQILAEPPWDFSKVEHWTVRQRFLSHKNPEPTQTQWAWKAEHLCAGRKPLICFVYDGIADDKVGITTKMAKTDQTGARIPFGITALRLPAPAVICYPPDVPHRDGSQPYCEQSRPGFASANILWIEISTNDLLVHYCESDITKIYSSHSLQIKDSLLTQMTHVYFDELQYIRNEGSKGVQGLLLIIMKRLRRILATQAATIGNTAYPSAYHLLSPQGAQSKSEDLCQRTIEYIVTHLRDSLTWKTLADQMSVSPFYLNHVFRKTTGMSVIRYVNFLRIEAAKEILSFELERISDIAGLVGFSGISSFGVSFKRQVGCSPSEFRHQSLKIKSSK